MLWKLMDIEALRSRIEALKGLKDPNSNLSQYLRQRIALEDQFINARRSQPYCTDDDFRSYIDDLHWQVYRMDESFIGTLETIQKAPLPIRIYGKALMLIQDNGPGSVEEIIRIERELGEKGF